jgi:hypothetical protein
MRADYSIVTANGESIEAFSRFDNHTKMFREALGNIPVEITLKDGSKKTVIKGDGQ